MATPKGGKRNHKRGGESRTTPKKRKQRHPRRKESSATPKKERSMEWITSQNMEEENSTTRVGEGTNSTTHKKRKGMQYHPKWGCVLPLLGWCCVLLLFVGGAASFRLPLGGAAVPDCFRHNSRAISRQRGYRPHPLPTSCSESEFLFENPKNLMSSSSQFGFGFFPHCCSKFHASQKSKNVFACNLRWRTWCAHRINKHRGWEGGSTTPKREEKAPLPTSQMRESSTSQEENDKFRARSMGTEAGMRECTGGFFRSLRAALGRSVPTAQTRQYRGTPRADGRARRTSTSVRTGFEDANRNRYRCPLLSRRTTTWTRATTTTSTERRPQF